MKKILAYGYPNRFAASQCPPSTTMTAPLIEARRI